MSAHCRALLTQCAEVATSRSPILTPEQRPGREQFVELVTEAVWLQIAGMAKGRGVELDPDVPVEALLEAAFDGTPG